MSDLIDRKALLKELRADYKDSLKDSGEGQLIAIGIESAIDIVKDAPAVSATVEQAEWRRGKHIGGLLICSNCGGSCVGKTTKYCPNCGAKMYTEKRPYSHILCVLDVYDSALEPNNTAPIWHDAKTDPPKTPGLYYGKKDDTNSMWLCSYWDGVWRLVGSHLVDSSTEMKITAWAEYTAFSSCDSGEQKEKIMIEVDGYKAFHGTLHIFPDVSRRSPFDITGDCLYKPETDCSEYMKER